MPAFLSLHDADLIAEESAPVVKPGLHKVFAGMIRNPAETLGAAFAHPIQAYAVAYAAAGGVYWALNLAIAQASGHTMSLPVMLAAVLFLGIPGGIAYLYALTILINWSCEIIAGESERRKVRMLLAYVGVPGLIALATSGLLKLAIFGQTLFMPERVWMSANPVLVWGLWFVDAVCFAWSLMLLIKGLKIMHGLGTGRAIAAATLPLVPIALIGLVFGIIAGWGLFTAPAW
ncbi:MAG TPA: YIP1 family protein [Candidatus Polarisedimenticolia bacterium]|jgi:hypothetical protein